MVLTPNEKPHCDSQTYYWSDQWQEAEREAERDINEGGLEPFETVDQLIAALEQEQA